MKENKMGVMPVGKLLITMSLPMMASMLVQALYNIVDSMFVSRVSENALTAVSLAFPIQTLIIAFANGVGVGMNALLSRALGEKKPDEANKAARHGILLMAVCYLIFLVFGLFLTRPFLATQVTADTDPEILEYGVQYLSVVCIFSFGIFAQIASERLFQSTGRTVWSMVTQATGAIINIILDPIMIFGLAGFPRLGVTGAAVATVIGQITAAVLGAVLNRFVNREIRIEPRLLFRCERRVFRQMLIIGIPTTVMQAIGSVMSYVMNRILMAFSSTAAAVFGAYFKIQSFVCMPVFGLNAGMVPIIAYNYGARQKERIKKTVRYSVIFAECITAAGFLAFQLFPEALLGMFDASPYMLEIGVPALRIISIHFLLCGACIVIGSVFQALGNGVYSAIVSFLRQIVVLLPVAYIFSQTIGLQAVWWCFPIAETVSLAVSLFLLRRIYKSVVYKL